MAMEVSCFACFEMNNPPKTPTEFTDNKNLLFEKIITKINPERSF